MESWEKIKAVQRMQIYIEAHLNEPITLSMLAKAAGYSPWHAERLFNDLIGKTPFDEERFENAIGELWEAMKNYNPEIYGFKWADEDGPRFQLIPMGYRGYIEARPVRQLNA